MRKKNMANNVCEARAIRNLCIVYSMQFKHFHASLGTPLEFVKCIASNLRYTSSQRVGRRLHIVTNIH